MFSECVGIREINSVFQTTQELYLKIVSEKNDTFIEREWLKELIEERLFTFKRGVHLVGEPGYGKTLMILKLLDFSDSSVWSKLQNTVIFSHICRFDRSITQAPFMFIQNLARALLNEFPVMCNFFHTDAVYSKYFDEHVCSHDTVSCFEHLVIWLLQFYQENFASRRYTLVIDALDECQLAGEKYDIVDLLSMNLNKFPIQFEFVLTSRNTEEIVSKIRNRNMSLIKFADYKEQINNDISSYISMRNVSLNWNAELVKQFNGNFLYAKHFLDYCLKEPSCLPTDFPVSLKDTFEFNLIRIFGKSGEKFNMIRPVFEVLSVAPEPLTEEMLIDISDINDSATNVHNILGNELRHFVQISPENSVSLLHNALRDYLTDYSLRYSFFFVDRNKGHTRIANYLLKVFNITKNVEVIELAHYVALSKNKTYEDLFLLHSLVISRSDNISKVSYIYQTAMAYNCYDTMALILKYVGLIHIDDTNSDYKTASILAAEYGHVNTLKALLDFGADINFKIPCKTTIITELYTSKCGHSLLQIAAYNGHDNIVLFLLSLHHKRSIVIKCLHTKSKKGHISLLKGLLWNKRIVESSVASSIMSSFLMSPSPIWYYDYCNGVLVPLQTSDFNSFYDVFEWLLEWFERIAGI